MAFTDEQVDQLYTECRKNLNCLHKLMLQTVVEGQESDHEGVREHLLHGVSRRLNVIKKSIGNIFEWFPPETDRPLELETLADVQINLHAFMINLYGIFDNWAWAFVYKHNLENHTGGRRGVGLFNRNTSKYLPKSLRDYLSTETIINWHESYLKSYRDSLAHRIPLYIPPAEYTDEDADRYQELDKEIVNTIKAMEFDKLDRLYEEQRSIGRPSFRFLHAYKESEPPRPMLLHPQILSDAAAVIEFGDLFIGHWNDRA